MSIEIIKEKTITINMGPQHPSTHGVLRLVLELDGETIVKCVPQIGYLHTGVEKLSEIHNWTQNITHYCRLDYTGPMFNELAYCLAVEKLIGPELVIPKRVDYIRVMLCELTRIINHMVWVGTHALDIGAMSMMLYSFIEREKIMDLYEEIGGQRMMTSYIRIGGLKEDMPPNFLDHVEDAVNSVEKKTPDFINLLNANPIWLKRTQGIGVLSHDEAVKWGVSGAVARASGVKWDIRKSNPYCRYDEFDFEIPVGTEGDVYERYLCRMEEIVQAIKIIRQCVKYLRTEVTGPWYANHPKYTPPKREQINSSMEQLIHHFKYWTDGIRPEPGEAWASVESGKGELGFYVASDGGPKPTRVKMRPPSFANLQAISKMVEGHLIADIIAIIGSLDLVLGDTDK